jgi:hypothetical protein
MSGSLAGSQASILRTGQASLVPLCWNASRWRPAHILSHAARYALRSGSLALYDESYAIRSKARFGSSSSSGRKDVEPLRIRESALALVKGVERVRFQNNSGGNMDEVERPCAQPRAMPAR